MTANSILKYSSNLDDMNDRGNRLFTLEMIDDDDFDDDDFNDLGFRV